MAAGKSVINLAQVAAEAIAETYGLLRSEIIRTFVRAGIANARPVSIVVDDGATLVNA
jgi:hypothetical protein